VLLILIDAALRWAGDSQSLEKKKTANVPPFEKM
jgi:hypothetical protein